jgi:hypothetical protein
MAWSLGDIKNKKMREAAERQYREQTGGLSNVGAPAEAPGGQVAPGSKPTKTRRKTKYKDEAEFQAEVVGTLQGCGYRVAHFRPAWVHPKEGEPFMVTPVAADGKGFLDLLAIHDERGTLWVIECKMDHTDTTPEQKDWLRAWAKVVGAKVAVARPSNWHDLKLLF